MEVKRFLMVLVHDFAKYMRIPSKIAKILQEESSGSNRAPIVTTIIEDLNGRKYKVELEKTNRGMYFTFGWSKFVKDHGLNEGDFLIFQYNGFWEFSLLMIFDKNKCEKDVELLVISSDSSDDNSTEDDEEEEEVVEKTSYSKGKNGGKKIKRRGPIRMSKRRPVTSNEKKKAEKAANSFFSKKPFFVVRLRARQVYIWSTLRFPCKFSRDYLPRTTCTFTLRVSKDKFWDANYKPNPKERDCLSKGWSEFARENDLEEDDYCIFELLKPTEFQVHIFRVVEVATSSIRI